MFACWLLGGTESYFIIYYEMVVKRIVIHFPVICSGGISKSAKVRRGNDFLSEHRRHRGFM